LDRPKYTNIKTTTSRRLQKNKTDMKTPKHSSISKPKKYKLLSLGRSQNYKKNKTSTIWIKPRVPREGLEQERINSGRRPRQRPGSQGEVQSPGKI
jgi:hypothetical protein